MQEVCFSMSRVLIIIIVVVICLALFVSCTAKREVTADAAVSERSPLDTVVTDINGQQIDLSTYKGRVVLIVNTASKCGFTAQYKTLEELYEKYNQQGFVVLGFPSNDFGNQEPGSNEEIKTFCQKSFGVSFPMFAKGPVKGAEKQGLFKSLTESGTKGLRGEIGWNFEKFLIDRRGHLRARFSSFTTPTSGSLIESIEKLLAEQ